MKEKKSLNTIINISLTEENIIKTLESYSLDLRPDEYGNSVLHQLASMSGMSDKKIVEILSYLFEKEYSLDVNARNKRGETAFILAIKNHRFKFAEMLVQRGADIKVNEKVDNDIFNEKNVFYNLAISNYVYSADSEKLDDIHALSKILFTTFDIHQEDSENNNYLQQAILKSHFLLVKYFAEYSTDINYHRNKDGFRALELAAEYALLDVMLLLLRKGAWITRTIRIFSDGKFKSFVSPVEIFSYALFSAVKDNDKDKVKEILKYLSTSGDDKQAIEFKNRVLNQLNEGLTVLHIAVRKWREDIVKILIDAGADINTLSDTNLKPLFMIFKGKYIDITARDKFVTLFLNTKACNVNDTDNNGQTLLSLGCYTNYFGTIIKLLLKAGADVDKVDIEGHTPLHFAAFQGKVDYVEILLKAGALCIKSNNKGFKPLEFAISGYRETQKLLRSTYSDDDEFLKQCNRVLPNYCKIIEQLLDAGAGLYVNCCLQIPEGVNTEGKLVLGLCIESKPVNRTIKGFEKAITSIEELQSVIKQGIKLDRMKFIKFCNERLSTPEEINQRENLRRLKSMLYQLTPDSLINLCLNTLNQEKARFFRQAAITEANLLPECFKQALNPDVDEIVIEESSFLNRN